MCSSSSTHLEYNADKVCCAYQLQWMTKYYMNQESERLMSRKSIYYKVSLEYKYWHWHLYNLPSTSTRPTHLPTWRDILFANWVPQFTDPFEGLSCLVSEANFLFSPASTRNRTRATYMGGICINNQTMLSHRPSALTQSLFSQLYFALTLLVYHVAIDVMHHCLYMMQLKVHSGRETVDKRSFTLASHCMYLVLWAHYISCVLHYYI